MPRVSQASVLDRPTRRAKRSSRGTIAAPEAPSRRSYAQPAGRDRLGGPAGHREQSGQTVQMRSGPTPGRLPRRHRLTRRGTQPRLHPEHIARMAGQRRFPELCFLHDVPLHGHPDGQAGRPVGEERAQRHVETVERQPVTVLTLLSHRQPARHRHSPTAMSAVPLMDAMATAVPLTLTVLTAVVTVVGLGARLVRGSPAAPVRRVPVLVVSAVLGIVLCTMPTGSGVFIASAFASAVRSLRLLPAALTSRPTGFSLRSLTGRRTEPDPPHIERSSDSTGLGRLDPSAGRGHVLPEPVQRPMQVRAVMPGNQEEIRLGRGGRQGPVPKPHQALGFEPCRRPARQRGQQHAGPRSGSAQGKAGHVHRSAPSRQA